MQNYVIQLLRKSEFPLNKYMAHYINLMLKQLMLGVKNEEVVISIWGGCWGRTSSFYSTSVSNLVDSVFNGISFTHLKIFLINGYKSYNYNDVAHTLGKKFTPSTIKLGTSMSDHSKIFQVTIGGKVAFLMIGSTNFSRQQYVLPDSYNGSKVTNQEEVAFLNRFSQTSHLFFPGMGEDNMLMSRWLEENRGLDDLDRSEWAKFNMSLHNGPKYFPYSGKQSISEIPYELIRNVY
ncbi:hypothetical protein GPK32_04205 [Lactiplantibacillus plantarum]|uniref:hypothetical protein n=1 Tax=Lactiplantibacillus plantarum TaxID=1590 RepID=UPI0012FBEEFF|nr:hypothetical protein [Lactiplantibacillus plantarum]QGX68181.1 hypothetical protein GPK32_04205 [Lactiplantibacillus plantarum]